MSEYRSILKGISIFGGTQLVQIFVSLLKGKFTAVILGTVGVGIMTVYNTSMNFLTILSGLGISNSAVRDIAKANATNDPEAISRGVSVFKKCLLLTCMLGAALTVLLSPLLSYFSFNNFEYTGHFCLLALFLVFTQLSQGYITILKGLRKLKLTALSALYSSIAGLLISIPLLYLWGAEGIVPNLVLSSFASYIVSFLFIRKMRLQPVNVTFRTAVKEGREMLSLGVVSMISILLGVLVQYITVIFVTNVGSLTDVGLYNSATFIITQSVSLIFASMSADYYPKLINAVDNKREMNSLVNNQGEMILIISLPILLLMIVLSKFIIYTLLSPEFYPITLFLKWLCLAALFQAFTFPIGSISFAKGDKKTFFLMEAVLGSFMRLILMLLGYWFFGLDGMAVAFMVTYLIYIFIVLAVTKRLYGFCPSRSYLLLLIISSVILFSAISVSFINESLYTYLFYGLLVAFTLIFAYKELDKRIDIRQLIRQIKQT